MAIKPILFNAKMVRAILDGRKSCTRRIIKPQPQGYFEVSEEPLYIYDTDGKQGKITPPYQPGDILYIRETWAWCPCWDCGLDVEETGCGHEQEQKYNGEKKEHGCYIYRASCADNEYPSVDTWHPSIHMPKEAARIWLKVTGARVERLQDIDGKGCVKEGIEEEPLKYVGDEFVKGMFHDLWDSTIKKSDLDRYGWDANPWVFVYEFERCKKPKGV